MVISVKRFAWACRFGIVWIAVLCMSAGKAEEPQQGAVYQSPTDVSIVMSTSHGKYDGAYTLSEISRICGELAPEENMTGEAVFQLNFPERGNSGINDVTFSSKTLVKGVAETTEFYLSVNVQSATIGHPSAYVLDTRNSDNTGQAVLTLGAGTLQLKVSGVNDRGETINLTASCQTNDKNGADPHANF